LGNVVFGNVLNVALGVVWQVPNDIHWCP
jgi:hypothetical protein